MKSGKPPCKSVRFCFVKAKHKRALFVGCFPLQLPKGQSSLEYLLLLAAFFSAFAILLPSISFSVEQFFFASDAVLAKTISQNLHEQISLFSFLADGSKNVFEYSPSKSISVFSQGNSVFISSGEKSFEVNALSPQMVPNQEFSSKFFVQIEKINGFVRVTFSSNPP